MAQNFAIGQSLLVANTINPRNDSAVRTGDYVTLGRSHKGFFACHVTQGGAAMTLSILQGTNTSGAGSKALANNARIWLINDITIANPVPVRQADGVAFTTDAVASTKIIIFEVDPAMMDLVNAFTSVTVQTNGSGSGNTLSVVFWATTRSAEDQAASPRVN